MGEKRFGGEARMRAIYILAEGQTEEEFINEILRPHLYNNGINDVRAILMTTSSGHKGGDVSYQRFKRNAENLLKGEKDIIVTSLIDYFRLKTDFPDFIESSGILDKIQRVAFLEQGMSNSINHSRFVPYIQLHEFEGLLFSSVNGFDYLPDIPEKNRIELNDSVNEYENPELLNDGAETAPSKRLQRLIPGYRKTLHGPIIAHEISLPVMMQKCVRFKGWVEGLIKIMQS